VDRYSTRAVFKPLNFKQLRIYTESKSMSISVAGWHPQVQQWLGSESYPQAINFYGQAIATEPQIKSNYWYLGLLLLLQGQEAEAQATWFVAIAEGSVAQIELWISELSQILETEADQRDHADCAMAWTIRQHMREIQPTAINNLLRLLTLSFRLKHDIEQELANCHLIELLQAGSPANVSSTWVFIALEVVLQTIAHNPIIIDFTDACLPYIQDPAATIALLQTSSCKIAYSLKMRKLAAALLERALQLDPKDLETLAHLTSFYQDGGDYQAGIKTARSLYEQVTNPVQKVSASHLILRGLMSAGGYWQAAQTAMQNHKTLLSTLFLEDLIALDPAHTVRLFNAYYYLPYFADDIAQNRAFQNQVAQLCCQSVQQYAKDEVAKFRASHTQPRSTRPRLKVGYLSYCLAQHSVGWLARWLIQHHDRDRVELYGYFIDYKPQDELQEWYVQQMEHPCKIGVDCETTSRAIAERIHQDGIDILVDLDSITLDTTCEILAMKPAPVQVSWLGWDASGLPTVDYYVVDPYVLPESAQTFYTEKLWRLPQTYIAVDGFEVGVPTLRREDLEIPSDAVIYLSSQSGYKRHAETIKLQMQIIRQVPNSYFLIKGSASQEAIQLFFSQIAEEVGLDRGRLKFLPQVASEFIHRANLAIADVVLDTYPYNGATTTLETLWMGIPLVTRVGEQFAARNSYTMMMNAGITEGIAWTDAEYIEWGVRLGKDAALRQQIAWKLKASRHTAPLWNAKQFAREMETAYEQMWARYQAALA
jgi:predicted O-linked N-acetylglucosamine transferase (SPINDLY family)